MSNRCRNNGIIQMTFSFFHSIKTLLFRYLKSIKTLIITTRDNITISAVRLRYTGNIGLRNRKNRVIGERINSTPIIGEMEIYAIPILNLLPNLV